MSKKKILLVDDEMTFLEIMAQRIESWSWTYEVITASNGDEAMDAFLNKKPDAVILDYLMPDTTGVQILMKIRALDLNVPVIMFTAKPRAEAMLDTEKLNVLAFVPKLSPFTNTQANLRATLDMALRQKGEGTNKEADFGDA